MTFRTNHVSSLINSFEFAKALQDEMLRAGMDPRDIILRPGKYHRFKSTDCRSKCCAYRIFEGWIGAHYKCFRRGINVIWWYKDKQNLTQSEIMRFKAENQRLSNQKLQDERDAIRKIISLLKSCIEATDEHPYVMRKRIKPYAAFQKDKMLCIPITNIDGFIQSLQTIYPDGTKIFTANASTRGGMRVIGNISSDTLIICEGWATGCSIYEACGITTICAFYAVNLDPVIANIKKKYPLKKILLAADNDSYTTGNPGLKYGLAAAQKHDISMIYPDFGDISCDIRPTDFNDLMCLRGIECVENQILAQL